MRLFFALLFVAAYSVLGCFFWRGGNPPFCFLLLCCVIAADLALTKALADR